MWIKRILSNKRSKRLLISMAMYLCVCLLAIIDLKIFEFEHFFYIIAIGCLVKVVDCYYSDNSVDLTKRKGVNILRHIVGVVSIICTVVSLLLLCTCYKSDEESSRFAVEVEVLMPEELKEFKILSYVSNMYTSPVKARFGTLYVLLNGLNNVSSVCDGSPTNELEWGKFSDYSDTYLIDIININKDLYRMCEIIEYALDSGVLFDEIMDESYYEDYGEYKELLSDVEESLNLAESKINDMLRYIKNYIILFIIFFISFNSFTVEYVVEIIKRKHRGDKEYG